MTLDMGDGARVKGPKVDPMVEGDGVQRRLPERKTLRNEDESVAMTPGLDK